MICPVLFFSLRRRPLAFSLDIGPSTPDSVPIGGVVFHTPCAVPHECDSTISGPQELGPDASPNSVVSRRLLGRDAWPGTWLWRPVAAPVVGLLWPGALRVRRRRRRRGSRRCRYSQRRRFVGRSWGIGGGCCGSLFLAASGDGGGGAGGGVCGRLNW